MPFLPGGGIGCGWAGVQYGRSGVGQHPPQELQRDRDYSAHVSRMPGRPGDSPLVPVCGLCAAGPRTAPEPEPPLDRALLQSLERLVEIADPVVQLVLQPLRQSLPVLGPWNLAFRQLSERSLYLGDGQADALAGADHRNPAQHVAVVAPLVRSLLMRPCRS